MKKTTMVFAFQNQMYGKFWSISLELFVEHKSWNCDECVMCSIDCTPNIFFVFSPDPIPKCHQSQFSGTTHLSHQKPLPLAESHHWHKTSEWMYKHYYCTGCPTWIDTKVKTFILWLCFWGVRNGFIWIFDTTNISPFW